MMKNERPKTPTRDVSGYVSALEEYAEEAEERIDELESEREDHIERIKELEAELESK